MFQQVFNIYTKINVKRVDDGIDILLSSHKRNVMFMVDNFRAFYYTKLYHKQLLCIIPDDEPFYQSTMFFQTNSNLLPAINEMGPQLQPHLNRILGKYMNVDLLRIDSIKNEKVCLYGLQSSLFLYCIATSLSFFTFMFEIFVHRRTVQHLI